MTSPRPPGRTWLRAAPAGRLRQGHVRRWRWRHCNVSPPRSEMFDSNRRTRAERPSIPASGLLPCVTEDRCRSFCRPTWRRSEDEFATISITSSPVSGRISGPKSAVFPGPSLLTAQHDAGREVGVQLTLGCKFQTLRTVGRCETSTASLSPAARSTSASTLRLGRSSLLTELDTIGRHNMSSTIMPLAACGRTAEGQQELQPNQLGRDLCTELSY
jgi:hypothetical protein